MVRPILLRLSPYMEKDGAEIVGWPRDDREARAWGGNDVSFPVTPGQIARLNEDGDVRAFVGRIQDRLVSYVEVWVDEVEREIELARLIVHPEERGGGVGSAFVMELVQLAKSFGMTNLFLRVLPENERAIRCYRSAGFLAVPKEDQQIFNRGQQCKYLWMKYSA